MTKLLARHYSLIYITMENKKHTYNVASLIATKIANETVGSSAAETAEMAIGLAAIFGWDRNMYIRTHREL